MIQFLISWGRAPVFGLLLALVGAGAAVHAQPVINEVHYDPPDATDQSEFIELHNPGLEPIALGDWRLEGGIDFRFGPGTQLPAGGYVVVAQDPSTLRARFGVAALGPWSGRLSNAGERLELRNALGEVVDRVTYQLGFPWPTVGEAPGYSMELIHPGLDNDLGGHWRPSVVGGPGSGNQVSLVAAGTSWRMKKGTEAPSSPSLAWTQIGFSDDAWLPAVLPAGYDPALELGTALPDMRNNYSTFFLRRGFSVADPVAVTSLRMEAVYDDGFRVWINGTQVLNVNLNAGALSHTSTAGPARESTDFEGFEIALPAGLLRAEGNVMAVQVVNSSLTASSDCYFDVRVVGVVGPTGRGPTPGRRNVTYATRVPPAVRQVDHAPNLPGSGESVVVTAKVTDSEGVAGVTLKYQVVEPGAYVALSDAVYETTWMALPMNDLGRDGDTVAGDQLYSVRVPGSVQSHRRLIRYRVEAIDTLGDAVRVPYAEDPQPNFAWFVYDGVPAWSGAIRPGEAGEAGRLFTVDRAEMNRLPVLHLISKNSDVEQGTWLSRYGGDDYLWSGTLVYDGKVYDHIRYRARGGVWRYAMCKNMWKFDFNRGHGFEARDDWGRKLQAPWSKLNLGASIQQGDYNHRGEQGMFESTGFRVFRLAGLPAMHTAFTQLRVIDDAAESVAEDQYSGDFWGVYLMLEQPDGRFLEQHGLSDGNLFKMEGGGGELNHLGKAGPSDGSDLNEFLSRYTGATETWWRTNLHVPRYLSYQTVVQAIHHYDICYDKNFFYFRDAESSRWEVIPWDLDLTWAENMFDPGCGGVDRIKERLLPNATRYPSLWREWQNRIREFRDLFWNSDESWRLIDEQAGRLRGPATGPTILDADRAQWDYNPRMVNSTYSTSPSSKAGHGRYYRWPNYPAASVERSFRGAAQLMKGYVMYRATNSAARARNLDALAADTAIPAQPRIVYDGASGYPGNGLRFRREGVGEVSTLATVRWRLGEITRAGGTNPPSWATSEPWKYEVQAVWESGDLDPAVERIEIPAGVVGSGRVYRARVQVEDLEGRTSHWSEPVEFVASAAEGIADLTRDLELSEIMYHASEGSDLDFLEFRNSGVGTLDLGGASFSAGITFTFPAGTRIPAGGYLVLCKDSAATGHAAFRAAYGVASAVAIVGPYSGNLSDAGEQVVLEAAGGGATLINVTYSDGLGWPPQADGAGHSLVPVSGAAAAAHPGLDHPGHWRGSTYVGGSPGGADPEPVREVMLNEVVAHTDFLSEFDSNDWVEVYRAAETPFVFGAGWYLSDDPENLVRWRIPAGTTVPARGFLVFDEVTGFNRPAGTGFSINKEGEQVFLSHFPAAGRGGVVDAIAFKGQENDWALARVPDGGEFWDAVFPRTRASANAAPGARVVLSEVFYHPGGYPTNAVTENLQEYVELQNLSTAPVPLFNTNAVWRLNGGITFDLPLFVTLAAGERVVIVSFDPAVSPVLAAAFRTLFKVPEGVRLFGPFTGRLDNDTDRVVLERAQSPDTPGEAVSWVVVDDVVYADRGAWPETTDGGGLSLYRRETHRPGRDPTSWAAGTPSPGSAPATGEVDADADGMPDAWERQYGLDPARASDAAEDRDQDGVTNLAEYLSGTDPTSAASALRLIAAVANEGAEVILRYEGVAGRAYVLEARAPVSVSNWREISSVSRLATTQTIEVRFPAGTTEGEWIRVRLVP